MLKKQALADLLEDFKSWGCKRVQRVQMFTKRYGVICSETVFSDGKAG